MGSPRTNQAKVASYRCDEKNSGLGAVGLLGPVVLADLGGLSVSAGCAHLLLLVIRIATAATAANVCGLLASTHGWCTFGHALT